MIIFSFNNKKIDANEVHLFYLALSDSTRFLNEIVDVDLHGRFCIRNVFPISN